MSILSVLFRRNRLPYSILEGMYGIAHDKADQLQTDLEQVQRRLEEEQEESLGIVQRASIIAANDGILREKIAELEQALTERDTRIAEQEQGIKHFVNRTVSGMQSHYDALFAEYVTFLQALPPSLSKASGGRATLDAAKALVERYERLREEAQETHDDIW